LSRAKIGFAGAAGYAVFAKPVDRDYRYHCIVKWKRSIAEQVVRIGIEAGSLHMPFTKRPAPATG
jgi:hypothetical protein